MMSGRQVLTGTVPVSLFTQPCCLSALRESPEARSQGFWLRLWRPSSVVGPDLAHQPLLGVHQPWDSARRVGVGAEPRHPGGLGEASFASGGSLLS